jgi:hypothetical protein
MATGLGMDSAMILTRNEQVLEAFAVRVNGAVFG